jgi:hypothetical protein
VYDSSLWLFSTELKNEVYDSFQLKPSSKLNFENSDRRETTFSSTIWCGPWETRLASLPLLLIGYNSHVVIVVI